MHSVLAKNYKSKNVFKPSNKPRKRNSRREAKKSRDSIVGTNVQSHGTRAEYVNHCVSASPV